MYKILFFLLLSLWVSSCSKKSLGEQEAFNNVTTYQYHNYYGIDDFSFLSEYKSLKALDLSGSNLKDLSFIKKIPKLELLILEDIDIEENEIEKNVYGNNFKYISSLGKVYIKNTNNYYNILNKYYDLFFYVNNKIFYYIEDNINNGFSASEVKVLNFLKKIPIKFSNIIGILRFINLERLKIFLYNDNYIIYVTKLKHLKELHLLGNIYNLPSFQKSLKKLYLYNIKIDDFSFLKNSSVEYLYIVTRDYNNKRWKKLKKEYPNIKIEVNNLLWLPKYNNSCNIKNYYLTNVESYSFHVNENKYYYFYIDDTYIYGNCKVIDKLRDNLIDFNLTRENLVVLVDKMKININQLWDYSNWSSEKFTFLDIVINNNDKVMVDFLFFLGGINNTSPRRACVILKKKCSKLRDDIQKILDEKY